MVLKVVCRIRLWEYVCVECSSESGGVWNMALRVEVCGIGSERGVCRIRL